MATKTRTATDRINARILALVTAGLDPVDALRLVVGSDVVDAMIDRLYAALRAERRVS